MLNGADKIDGLTPEQLEQINGLANGLNSKNQELLDKLSANKGNNELNSAELESLKQFKHNAELKAAEDAKNWNEATKLKDESHLAAIEKAKEKTDSLESVVSKLLIDNGLNVALDGVSINPSLKEGALAIIKSSAKIVDGQAMIGDKSLSEYVKDWASTDTGKAFCVAPNNSGGGAAGNGAKGGESGKEFKDMTLTEKTALAKSDPDKFNELNK